MALNKPQRRAVWATFTHVNELLEDVERLVQAKPSLFHRQHPDLTQQEARDLAALASELRTRMLEALAALGIPDPEPQGSARWNVRTSLLYAGIALSELEGRSLGAYGSLSEQDEKDVTALARDLRRLVDRGRELLGGTDGAQRPGGSDEA